MYRQQWREIERVRLAHVERARFAHAEKASLAHVERSRLAHDERARSAHAERARLAHAETYHCYCTCTAIRLTNSNIKISAYWTSLRDRAKEKSDMDSINSCWQWIPTTQTRDSPRQMYLKPVQTTSEISDEI